MKNKKSKVKEPRLRKLLIPLLILVLAVSVRIPFYQTVFWRTPDAAEYINVARNINSGKGLTQSIEWHFFEDSPVVTSAFKGRPVMTAVLISGALKIHDSLYTPQMLILLLGAVNVVLFYFLARHFLQELYSVISSVFFAINPNVLISNRTVLSEFVALFFILSTLLLHYRLKNSVVKPVMIGVFIALTYLTRVETLILLPLFLFLYRSNKEYLSLIFISFVLVTLPYFAGNYMANGSPFYTYNTHHFRVDHFSEGMTSFKSQFPNPGEYILNNIPNIFNKIFGMVVNNIKSLADFAFFGLLSIPLLLYILKKFKKFVPELAFVTYIFIWYSIVWSAFIEAERGFMVIYVLLLIPAFLGLKKMKPAISLSIILVTLLSYSVLSLHRIDWAWNVDPNLDEWSYKKQSKMYDWIKKNTDEDSIIAAPSPWLTNLFTYRPSITLPEDLDSDPIKEFVSKYKVKYIITPASTTKDMGLVKVYSDNNSSVYCYKSCAE